MVNLVFTLFTLTMLGIILDIFRDDSSTRLNKPALARRLTLLLLVGLFSLLLFFIPENVQGPFGLIELAILLSVRLPHPLSQGMVSVRGRFTKAARLFPNIAR